jgi:hypothetical protein
MVPVSSQAVAFSKETALALAAECERLEEPRWFKRHKINSIPTTVGNTAASYWFLGDKQQPKAFNQLLRDLAPVIPGIKLDEAIINRYLPGDFMPEHIDRSLAFVNVVIPLTDTGEGLTRAGELVVDQPGVAHLFPATSVPHAVPPVTKLRYSLIYLYR